MTDLHLDIWFTNLISSVIHHIVPFTFILVAGILIVKIILRIINKTLEKSKLEKAAHTLIKSVARVVLYLLLGLIAASSLGIDVTGIIALASVLSLAVSLSVQNALTNIIGGFTLLYTKPFSSGDYVQIAEEAGTVSEIGMSYTKLITSDNKVIYIPNSAVVSADITNYSVTGTRRVELEFSVSYDAPTDQVLAALLKSADMPEILSDPAPFAAVKGYGDSTVNYILRAWTASGTYWDVNFGLNKRVREVFQAEGIDMSYPHLNVHLDK